MKIKIAKMDEDDNKKQIGVLAQFKKIGQPQYNPEEAFYIH
jgi:hypothetical protein|tara:strand:+ start:33 stop:155 length:123 start_codon:yes stop_codon:yes gene_type:complete